MRKPIIYLLLFCIATISSASATDYYYNYSGGDDANDCSTPALACKTLVDSNGKAYTANDVVYFAGGETWRTQTDAYLNCDSGTSAGNVTYTSYGHGRPLFLGSINASSTGNWTASGTANKWNSTFTMSTSRDVGNAYFGNGSYGGYKKSSFATMTTQGDFYHSLTTGVVNMYSIGNPGTYYSSIELAAGQQIVDVQSESYVIIENFDIRNSGHEGIVGSMSRYIYIRNNSVKNIGGSYQTGTIRYGNGIDMQCRVQNVKIHDNYVSQVYDAAIVPFEAYLSCVGGAQNDSDIEIYNNIVVYSGNPYQTLSSNTSSIVNNISVHHNTFGFAGDGWYKGQRPDHGINILLGTYHPSNTHNYIFKDNIIYNSATEYINLGWDIPGAWRGPPPTFDYNLYYEPGTAQLIYWNTTGYTNFTLWQITHSQESHGAQGNPLFLSFDENDLDFLIPSYNSTACNMSSTGSYIGALPCQEIDEPVINYTVNYTGDCDSTCHISTKYYNATLTEGVIKGFIYYNISNSQLARNLSDDWGFSTLTNSSAIIKMGALNTSTICAVLRNKTELWINCSNTDAQNNWTFFPSYIKVNAKVMTSTSRHYWPWYSEIYSPKLYSISNGTNIVTTTTGLADWDSATGLSSMNQSNIFDGLLAIAWNDSVTTDFDYTTNRSLAIPGIAIARSSELSANTVLTTYIKALNKNLSQSGDQQVLQPLNAFKLNPLYGDPVEEEPPIPPSINYSMLIPYFIDFESSANTTIWQKNDTPCSNAVTSCRTNPENWTVNDTGSDYHNSPTKAFIGREGNGNYKAYLYTPTFMLNGSNQSISMYLTANMEENYDGLYLEYNINNSVTWYQINTSSNNVNFTTPPFNTYGGYGGHTGGAATTINAFSGILNKIKINLSSTVSSGNLSLRFIALSDANTLCTTPPCGAWLDDFNITYSPLGEEEPPSPSAVIYPPVYIADRAIFIRSGVLWI